MCGVGAGVGGTGGGLNRFYVAKNSAKLFCLPSKKGNSLKRSIFFTKSAFQESCCAGTQFGGLYCK